MAVDKDFIESFKQQTKLLRKLKERVDEAVARADKTILRLQKGEI